MQDPSLCQTVTCISPDKQAEEIRFGMNLLYSVQIRRTELHIDPRAPTAPLRAPLCPPFTHRGSHPLENGRLLPLGISDGGGVEVKGEEAFVLLAPPTPSPTYR